MRIERRQSQPTWTPVLIPVLALASAAVIGAGLLITTGHDPLLIYSEVAQAGVLAPGALSATLVSSAPLMLASLAAAIAFRIRLWNIGAEGQLYLGAVGAIGVALALGDRLGVLVVPAMALAGAAAGAAWAVVPALLKAYLRTNEIITTLMLNYLAALFIAYLIFDSNSYWRDLSTPSALVFPRGKELQGAAVWPILELPGVGVQVPLGFFLAVLLAAATWLFLHRTRAGFEARVVGDSEAAAAYSGIRIKRTVVTVICLSGALAGLAGASDSGDFRHVLDPVGMQASGFGYGGIVVAALSRYNAAAVPVVAVLLGALYSAGYSVSGSVLPSGLVGILQGVLLFSVIGAEALMRYRIAWDRGRPPVLALQQTETRADRP